MKKIISILIMSFALFTVGTAQTTTTQYSSRNGQETVAKVVTTTDSTATYIDSIKLSTNQTGICEVDVIGYAKDTSYSVTGKIIFRFNKRRGTLTIGTIEELNTITRDAILAHTALGGATFTAVAVNNQIYIRVKGVTDTNVPSLRWYSITKMKSQLTK